jgi:hypothetical protein
MRSYEMEFGEDYIRYGLEIFRSRNKIEEIMTNRDRSKFLINYLSYNYNFKYRIYSMGSLK